jgi:hypothetical protein
LQCDDDTIDTTWYGSRRLEAIYLGDMHCLGVNVASGEQDIGSFVMWWDEKIEEGGNKKCWVHPYCNRSGECGTCVVARELG